MTQPVHGESAKKPLNPPSNPNDRVQFVERDKVLGHLKNMPKTTDGLLVVSPLGQDNPDDYAQLAMHVNPDFYYKGSMSFLVNTRTGDGQYDVLDLNNLPPGVQVQVIVSATDGSWRQASTFRGTEGNTQGADGG